jgi:hypothetical protein
MVIATPSLSTGWGMTPTSCEGNRVESAALTAASVTLRNGACPIQHGPIDTHSEQTSASTVQIRPRSPPITNPNPTRPGIANNDSASLTGSYDCRSVLAWINSERREEHPRRTPRTWATQRGRPSRRRPATTECSRRLSRLRDSSHCRPRWSASNEPSRRMPVLPSASPSTKSSTSVIARPSLSADRHLPKCGRSSISSSRPTRRSAPTSTGAHNCLDRCSPRRREIGNRCAWNSPVVPRRQTST